MFPELEERVTRQTQIYRALEQGLKTLHDPQDAEVDILAVPGLGTNPEECWTWSPKKHDDDGSEELDDLSRPPNESAPSFNWLRDPDGLASLFPKARIMLYCYASAWRGSRKVRATMKDICTVLLDNLKERRKSGNEITRPLIIIAHSMGGVVVAKALCIAKGRREFESIVTYTVGCAFFGCPFRGTDMAKIALLYSSVFGDEAYESLLSFMKSEKNDTLDEVTGDFVEICGKFVPPIELFCAWEQNPTSVSYTERFAQIAPGLLNQNFFKKLMETSLSAALGSGTHFVEKESAVLPGAHSIGLTAGHSDLIKFESVTSTKFVPVKLALTEMVQKAKPNARKRALQSGERLLPQRFLSQVRQSLAGVDMSSRFRARAGSRPVTSWLASEPLYQEWLDPSRNVDSQRSYLWLKGGAGFGKTNASLVAIQGLEKLYSDQDMEANNNKNERFLAYFLCDSSSGCCSAEDVLKGLIIQLINQDESLAQHARWFVPNPKYRGPAHRYTRLLDDDSGASGAKATATVDNLWKCLQDMLEDPVADNVHIVVNNLHCLESDASTAAFLAKLSVAAFETTQKPFSTARWLVTSRNDNHIGRYLDSECISVIDLEDDAEYGGKVKVARQNHARDAVMQLKASKGYTPDFAYYIRNFVESQSEDAKWIDILCILLEAKPSESSSLSVRKWLREAGTYNINKLVGHAWDTILGQDEDAALEIEELMYALAIAYESLTMADLAVLTQIDDPHRLADLVRRCSPVLRLDETCDRIIFTHPNFKEILFALFYGSADSTNPIRRRHHGLVALRCFKHIKALDLSAKTSEPTSETFVDATSANVPPSATLASDGRLSTLAQEEQDSRETYAIASAVPKLDCDYPTRYLFRHLSEAFPDAVQDLCEDDPAFWTGQSVLRDGWLKDFQKLTNDLKDFKTDGMSTLHVAAGTGANDLTSILVNKCKALSSQENADGMTALHVAASNNHPNTVDTLIRAGADIEAGKGDAGTPLHFAALRGNCSVMKLMIDKGSDVNAVSETIGPVINAAIRSGTVDAVRLVMSGDIHFDFDYTKCEAPLSLSAGISEPTLFRDILQSGRAKWLQNAKLVDQALVAASYSGRLESVMILLDFAHGYTNNTLENAVLSAALEKKWPTVDALLDYIIKDTTQGNRRDVMLDEVFHLATTSREEQLPILEKIWTFKNGSISKAVCDYSLYQAAALNKTSTVDWLLDTCGANANATSEQPSSTVAYQASSSLLNDFWNPLNAAASSGNVAMLKSLIRKDAEIDGVRGYALQLAASEGHKEAVETLLKHGALPDRKVADSDELGFFDGTALQAACDNKRVDVVRCLLEHGANPNLGGGTFTSPIIAATQKAQPEILELLVRAPEIDVNVVGNEDHSTPLINAAANMSMSAVKLLIQHGASIDAKNSAGDTALIMAAFRGDEACVELLCNEGADVTYRSPGRGLAIVAAASALHPSCATVLADKMGLNIETYREQVKIDPSKERLTEARALLDDYEKTIENLNSELAETQENLESATKDIDWHKHEMQRFQTNNSFQGETYESAGHQIKAMESERIELLKQLEAARGQAGLANGSVEKIQAMLNHEKQTNAALRKRQELNSLQDQIQAAHKTVETEKLKNTELRSESRALRDEMAEMRREVESAREAVKAEARHADAEKQKQEALKDELRTQEAKYREAVLATVKAEEDRDAARRQSSPQTPHRNSDGHERPSLPPRGQSDTVADRSSTSPGGTTPGTPLSPSGFRTIHGTHRPDGSLGGWRNGRVGRGLPPPAARDSLYDSSIAEEPVRRRPLNAQNSYSDTASAAGSNEATEGRGGARPGMNGGD